MANFEILLITIVWLLILLIFINIPYKRIFAKLPILKLPDWRISKYLEKYFPKKADINITLKDKNAKSTARRKNIIPSSLLKYLNKKDISIFIFVIVGIISFFILIHPQNVKSINISEGQFWDSHNQNLVVELDFPGLISKNYISLSKENKGEWRREKLNDFDLFNRKLVYYPETTFFPGENIDIYLNSNTLDWKTSFKSGFYSGSLDPKVFITDKVDNMQKVNPRQSVIVEIRDVNIDAFDFEIATEPEYLFIKEYIGENKYQFTPVYEYKNGESYKLSVLASPASINVKSKEIVRVGDKKSVYKTSFVVAEAPKVLEFSPEGENVFVSEQIVIKFSSPIDTENIQKLIRFAPEIPFETTWNVESYTLQIIPTKNFEKDSKYELIIDKKLKSTYGASMQQDLESRIVDIKNDGFEESVKYTFKTIGVVGIMSTSPQSNAANVDIKQKIQIKFNQEVEKQSAQTSFSISPNIQGSFSWSGNTLIFTPASDLAFSTKYTVTIKSGVKSREGLDLKTNFSFSFTTKSNRFELANFPQQFQLPDYQFGCNVTAASMVITYKGRKTTNLEVYNQLPKNPAKATLGPDGKPAFWGDPNIEFVGTLNPGSGEYMSYGVYWNPIRNAINQMLGGNRATVYRNYNLKDMLTEVQNGNPAILWWQNGASSPYSLSWQTAGGSTVTGVNGMHSEVVIGFIGTPENPTSIIVQDPWRGKRVLSVYTFNNLWKYYSNTAVVVR